MKIAVIKFGGHVLEKKQNIKTLTSNIKYLQKNNYKIIIVHGGTPTVNKKLNQMNIKSELVNGYRKTTKKIMNIIQESILGNEVINIVKTLNQYEVNAIAMNGTDGKIIRCKKKTDISGLDYGFVGEVISINQNILSTLLQNNIVPVISPIGIDDQFNSYNLNSDFLASKIAIEMKANLLFMITNVNGVYMNIKDPLSRIKILDKESIEKLILEGIITPVMQTKVNACLDYVKELNNEAYIIDSKQKINYKLFSTLEYGTKVMYKKENIYFRLAHNNDIKTIIQLMKKAFNRYQENISYKIAPLQETYNDLVKEIYDKFVFVAIKDNEIIGSIRLFQDKNIGKISRVCISPSIQNTGIGTLMLKYIENYANKLGITTIGLTTLNNVEYLKHFYTKNNYVLASTNNSRGYERALYIKNLQSNVNQININFYF